MYLSGLTVNKVLIADDCELNSQLLTFFLEKLNINVMSASNGLEALELTKKHSFDLVLMDIRMPKMSGDETAEKIRTLKSATRSNVPIIGMTSLESNDTNFSLPGEFDECLNKPLNQKALYQVPTKYFTSRVIS